MAHVALVEEFVDPDRDDAAHAKALEEICRQLKAGEFTITDLVVDMGEYLTTEQNPVRARGTLLLGEAVRAVKDLAEVEVPVENLKDFYVSRMADFPSLRGVLIGAHALLLRSTIPASEEEVMTAEGAAELARAMLTEVNVQGMPQVDRKVCLEIMLEMVTRFPEVVQEMGTEFVEGVIAAVDGEKDPRNLLLSFSLLEKLPQLLSMTPELTTVLQTSAEELFDVLSLYFPISFTPPPNDPYGITKKDLEDGLIRAFTATPLYAPFAYPLIFEKMGATLATAKLASLTALRLCTQVWGLTSARPFCHGVWDTLKPILLPNATALAVAAAPADVIGLTKVPVDAVVRDEAYRCLAACVAATSLLIDPSSSSVTSDGGSAAETATAAGDSNSYGVDSGSNAPANGGPLLAVIFADAAVPEMLACLRENLSSNAGAASGGADISESDDSANGGSGSARPPPPNAAVAKALAGSVERGLAACRDTARVLAAAIEASPAACRRVAAEILAPLLSLLGGAGAGAASSRGSEGGVGLEGGQNGGASASSGRKRPRTGAEAAAFHECLGIVLDLVAAVHTCAVMLASASASDSSPSVAAVTCSRDGRLLGEDAARALLAVFMASATGNAGGGSGIQSLGVKGLQSLATFPLGAPQQLLSLPQLHAVVNTLTDLLLQPATVQGAALAAGGYLDTSAREAGHGGCQHNHHGHSHGHGHRHGYGAVASSLSPTEVIGALRTITVAAAGTPGGAAGAAMGAGGGVGVAPSAAAELMGSNMQRILDALTASKTVSAARVPLEATVALATAGCEPLCALALPVLHEAVSAALGPAVKGDGEACTLLVAIATSLSEEILPSVSSGPCGPAVESELCSLVDDFVGRCGTLTQLGRSLPNTVVDALAACVRWATLAVGSDRQAPLARLAADVALRHSPALASHHRSTTKLNLSQTELNLSQSKLTLEAPSLLSSSSRSRLSGSRTGTTSKNSLTSSSAQRIPSPAAASLLELASALIVGLRPECPIADAQGLVQAFLGVAVAPGLGHEQANTAAARAVASLVNKWPKTPPQTAAVTTTASTSSTIPAESSAAAAKDGAAGSPGVSLGDLLAITLDQYLLPLVEGRAAMPSASVSAVAGPAGLGGLGASSMVGEMVNTGGAATGFADASNGGDGEWSAAAELGLQQRQLLALERSVLALRAFSWVGKALAMRGHADVGRVTAVLLRLLRGELDPVGAFMTAPSAQNLSPAPEQGAKVTIWSPADDDSASLAPPSGISATGAPPSAATLEVMRDVIRVAAADGFRILMEDADPSSASASSTITPSSSSSSPPSASRPSLGNTSLSTPSSSSSSSAPSSPMPLRPGTASSATTLSKRGHASEGPLYKQRFLSAALPVLLQALGRPAKGDAGGGGDGGGAVESGQELQNSRRALFLAVSHLLKNVPQSCYIHQSEQLFPVLLEALHQLAPGARDREELLHCQLILSAFLMDREHGQKQAEKHLDELITVLLALTGYEHSRKVRETALQCLEVVSSARYKTLYPYKQKVLRTVTGCLDDRKRSVRAEAVRCKVLWSSLAAST
eukprot:jgi/Mesvir1/24422/Mv11082-RA.1